MILNILTEADRYGALIPGLAAAFAFLRRPDLAELANGRSRSTAIVCTPLWLAGKGGGRAAPGSNTIAAT